jgi:hypothetical protein
MIVARILQIFRNEKASPFFSFLIGLGVSVMLFHKPIHTRLALALPVSEVESETIKIGDRCFRYVAEDSQCEILSSK